MPLNGQWPEPKLNPDPDPDAAAPAVELPPPGGSGRVRTTALLGAVYQGVFAVTQLGCLALLVRHTTRDVYGLWMTILALTSWAPMMYFGQPAALLTKMGSVALTSKPLAESIFTASLAIVLGVASVSLAALLLAGPWLSWVQILNAQTPASADLAKATACAALAVAFLANPATMANFAVMAHQRGHVVHLTMIAASCVGLLAFTAGVLGGHSLKLTGALMICGPLLGGLALWLMIGRRELACRPRWRALDIPTLRMMWSVGLHFVAIDLVTLAIVRTPDLIVAQLHGAEAVGIFSSVGRLPMLMLAVFQTTLLPYWPVLGAAMQRGDMQAVRSVIFKSLRMQFLVCALGTLTMALLGARFVRAWLGTDDASIPSLVAAACLQSPGLALLAWVSVMFSAMSMFRQQVALLAATAVIYLALSVQMGQALGPPGVAAAQAITLLCFMTPVGCWLLHRNVQRQARQASA